MAKKVVSRVSSYLEGVTVGVQIEGHLKELIPTSKEGE